MAPKLEAFTCFYDLIASVSLLLLFVFKISGTLLFLRSYLLILCDCRRVEEVVRYPGLPPRRQLTYQAKQTISREMEQEKMRRAEQLMLQRNPAVVRRRMCNMFCLADCAACVFAY